MLSVGDLVFDPVVDSYGIVVSYAPYREVPYTIYYGDGTCDIACSHDLVKI